ncbi:MAG: hypothetical protein PHU25_06070 [Deltaproteobacteria bacterium]|nr:hypothetical protein [Deltaproteobacteria bacterium]
MSKRKGRKPKDRKAEAPADPEPRIEAPFAPPRVSLLLWIAGLAVVFGVFLVLKMFSVNPVAGDEHIYLYQAKLVSEGVAPYSGFAMAHPPLQTLFAALLIKLFGYHFLLARLLPVLFCLAGGVALAALVRRELGALASVAATAVYVLSYEPLRSASHFTGVNMTVALVLGAVLAYRTGRIRTAAALCAAAVLTRLYAVPGVLTLAAFALLADRRAGLRLTAYGLAIGAAAFVAVGLWAGFGDMVHNVLLYQVRKTPMAEATLENMKMTVLFHNAPFAALFVLALPAVLARASGAWAHQSSVTRPSFLARLASVLREPGAGLLVLASLMAILFLAVLLRMNRVWMYYFIPPFPFAAIPAGYLVSRWILVVPRLVRARGRIADAGLTRMELAGGMVLFILLAAAFALAPRLERSLRYFDDESEKSAHAYTFRPGLLPDFMNSLVRATVWSDERVIGDRYSGFTYLLWHESRVLDVADDMAREIASRTKDGDAIFGDSGTVPLLALMTGRRIAGNEVDTNIQRYRSGNADPEEMVRRIDTPSTRLILVRPRFGVAGLPQLQELLKARYTLVRTFRTAEDQVFLLYERRPEGAAP